MCKIVEFLEGKKAYIVGVAMVLCGLYNADNSLVLQGFAVITLRAGISKIE
jgi:uncharacterized membrane protein YiaA